MLAATRTLHPEALNPIKDGVTDVRLFRVMSGGTTGLHIQATPATS